MLTQSLRPQSRPQTLVHRVSQARNVQSDPERIATTRAPLPPRNALMLIGIFGPETAPQALIRTPSGTVEQIARGDRIANYPVLAITADAVILQVNGQAQKLVLP